MITVAILLPVDNRRYFTIGAILDNRLVLTINRTKLLDYRKNDFHLLCSSLVLIGLNLGTKCPQGTRLVFSYYKLLWHSKVGMTS